MSSNIYDQTFALNIMYISNLTGNSKGFEEPVTAKDYSFVENMSKKEDIFDTPFFSKQKKISEMEIKKLSGKNEANNAEPCPRCGGARYNIDKQTRSSDEARSFYIKCGSCGLTQSE